VATLVLVRQTCSNTVDTSRPGVHLERRERLHGEAASAGVGRRTPPAPQRGLNQLGPAMEAHGSSDDVLLGPGNGGAPAAGASMEGERGD
jgi:hypothetical protein